MQELFSPAYLFISHDLNVVGFMCQRIIVMYLGMVVEEATTIDLFNSCKHPYTKALLNARNGEKFSATKTLKGELPSPINLPSGCVFHPRCPYAKAICVKEEPTLHEVEKNWFVRCHLA